MHNLSYVAVKSEALAEASCQLPEFRASVWPAACRNPQLNFSMLNDVDAPV